MVAQHHKIEINAVLNTTTHTLQIQQYTTFINNSVSPMDTLVFYNWANAYKDKHSPLAKRFISDYSKSFHFAKNRDRGHVEIHSITINDSLQPWFIHPEIPDILKLPLKKALGIRDSIRIKTVYSVKLPKNKYSKYGFHKYGYDLKYWYLAPALTDARNIGMSNLNMDDMYVDYMDYSIDISIPANYDLHSNLQSSHYFFNNYKNYRLRGTCKTDIEMAISTQSKFETITTEKVVLLTNLNSNQLSPLVKEKIVQTQLDFLQQYLGDYPHKKLFINRVTYDKNPVYGWNQLPSFLAPFSDSFEWDIKLFKVLTKKYIDQLILVNKRNDYWLIDGLQTYLMIKYVEKYYPDQKILGKLSNVWGIRKFNLAKAKFNDKYPFVYQFSARKNLDQALTTPADSLSTFNRKIVGKYKAGLGLRYVDEYLGDSIVPQEIAAFFKENFSKKTTSSLFLKRLEKRTDKDLSSFSNYYLNTSKKIDYTIESVQDLGDSLAVTIKNKRDFKAPVLLYGIQDKSIKFKKWLPSIDSSATVYVKKNGFNKLSLNYEYLYPEYNNRDNWKSTRSKLLNRPIQFKLFKDLENPYYNQIFLNPQLDYNYYDGALLGVSFSNKSLLNKEFNYTITPTYGIRSGQINGSFSVVYKYLPQNSKIQRFTIGTTGNRYQYAPNLRYSRLSNFASILFKRKSYRDVGGSAIMASYVSVNKQADPNNPIVKEINKYGVLNIGYSYTKPEIIKDVRLYSGFQFAKNFSKFSIDARYRKLTNTNRQLDFRWYAGAFIHNNTASDFFSFALDRPSDYLFQYGYLGRSEISGFFSQQYITTEGGFKSKLNTPFANQWISTFNTSIGLWRWIEIYNDVGFIKNKGSKIYFAHENGIRLNFIHEILEVYFPIHSNLGWEMQAAHYNSKIRFVLTIQPQKIISFFRRGFY
ncbi:MAG: aminopeptidase [Flavobacteriaceae bacterium]|nr:MAG: aminopeptidase [Flavobacteriaceae bacterium]